MMSTVVDALSARLYPELLQRDPVVGFVERLDRMVRPHDVVLDLGAGAGERNRYALRGRVRRIVGIDLDPRVKTNPLLDLGVTGDISSLPFPAETFDVVFAIYVLEHVERPAALASDVSRVLRPGGVFLALTPNVAHYTALVSRATPTAFHRWFNTHRGRPAADTFPTWYRLNSRRALVRHFAAAGLEPVSIEGVEVRPNYLTFNPMTFLAGVAYERTVNAFEWLSPMRVNLVATFQKLCTAAPANDRHAR